MRSPAYRSCYRATAIAAHFFYIRCCEAGHNPCFLSPPEALSSQHCSASIHEEILRSWLGLTLPFPTFAKYFVLLQHPNNPLTALKHTFNKATSKKRRVAGRRFCTIFPIRHLSSIFISCPSKTPHLTWEISPNPNPTENLTTLSESPRVLGCAHESQFAGRCVKPHVGRELPMCTPSSKYMEYSKLRKCALRCLAVLK